MKDQLSRRERLRESAREEIKALARAQLAASGGASLQLNTIARAMGMVPSAIYRYYADRDALLTALIIEAFEGLAASLRAAVAAAPAGRLGAQMLAAALDYRRWAIAHPVDFQLIFGAPIPGYVAPPEQTGPAGRAVFGVFLDILQAAHAAGRLGQPPHYQPAALAPCPPDDAYAPLVMYTGIIGWTKMHGVIMLELVGHLKPAMLDGEQFYRAEMLTYLDLIGLAE